MGNRHGQLAADKFGRLGIGSIGLLKIEDVVFLDRPAKLHGRLCVGAGMVFHDNVHIGTDGFADRRHAGFHHLHQLGGEQTGAILIRITASILGGIGKEVDLDGVVPFGHRFLGYLAVFIQCGQGLGVVAPAELELAGIGAQIVPALAAQQLVDRHIERLALDVPEGNVQRGDAGEYHGAAVLPPEGGLVELVPDNFTVQGVHTDDKGRQVTNHTRRGRGSDTVGQRRFPIAVDALVGVDAAENGTPHGIFLDVRGHDVDLRDFHNSGTSFYL